jgi:hypothetical protein
MTVRIVCPGCRVPYLLAEGARGQRVCCKRCQRVFEVPAEEPPIVAEVVPDPAAPPAARREAMQPGLGGGTARPRPAREGARPAPAVVKSGSGLLLWLLLGGGAAAVLFVGCAGLAGYFLFLRRPSPSTQSVVSHAPVADQGIPGKQDGWEQNPPQHFPRLPDEPNFPGAPGPGGPIMPGQPPVKPFEWPNLAVNPPAAPHHGLKPPALAGDEVTKPLPAAVTDVTVGGGRYLLLRLGSQNKLAVFDANEARVVKYLPLEEPDAQVAAGMDKLVILLPDKKAAQRWSLDTLEREATAPLALPGKLQTLAMGSASNGPLFVFHGGDLPGTGGLTLIDVATLKSYPIPREAIPNLPTDGRQLRASADGRVFTFQTFQGFFSMVWQGKGIEHHQIQDRRQVFYALPGPDGRVIYTANGTYTTEWKPINEQLKGSMPGHHGPYFLAGQSSVYLEGDNRPLLTQPAPKPEQPPDIGALVGLPQGLPLDRRVHFLPDADLVVMIPMTDDRLVLKRLDVEAAPEKSGVDYLLVLSRAPHRAKKGATYRYPMAVRSKKGGVKYKLESAPKGMRVSADGVVTWDVPGDQAENDVDVLITVSDRTGQEVLHSFKVRPGDRADEPVPVAVRKAPRPPEPPVKEPDPAPAPPPGAVAPSIKPPVLEQARVVRQLPSAIGDVCVGGGGRYLVLHLPKAGKLAVFDVSAAKVVKELPVDDPEVHFAAGADKLLVALPGKRAIQRWSLTTFEREATAPLALAGKLHALAMGSASGGPLLVCSGRNGEFLDPATLRPSTLKWADKGMPPVESPFVRASANGQVFTFREGAGGEPHTVRAVTVNGEQASFTEAWGQPPSILAPSADGKVLYSGYGIYTPQLRPISLKEPEQPATAPKGPRRPPVPRNRSFLPAEHGSYFMELDIEFGKPDGTGALSFYVPGNDRPLTRLENVEGVYHENIGYGKLRGTLCHDHRIHLIPDAKLLVTIPAGDDRLVLRRFDVEEALKKSGADYLVVTTQPPRTARKGARYTYQIGVQTNKGGMKYRLDAGPPGMRVSPRGLVTWAVPADFKGAEVDVLLTLTSGSGQEVLHAFKIRCR